jgi:hypothetical protein
MIIINAFYLELAAIGHLVHDSLIFALVLHLQNKSYPLQTNQQDAAASVQPSIYRKSQLAQ